MQVDEGFYIKSVQKIMFKNKMFDIIFFTLHLKINKRQYN